MPGARPDCDRTNVLTREIRRRADPASWTPWEGWIMHQHPHRSTGPVTAAALALLALAIACDGTGGVFVGGPDGRAVQEVLVSPENATIAAGNTLQFQARSVMSDGDTINNP